MGLNFLENLGFNEAPTPLSSLSELNDTGKSQEEQLKQTDDDTQITEGQPTRDALPSINALEDTTSTSESAEDATKTDKSKESKNTSDKKYISFLKELNEKLGITEDFKEEDYEDSIDTIIDYLEEWSDTTAESKLDTHIKTNLNPELQKYLDLIDSGVDAETSVSIISDIKALAKVTPEKIEEDIEVAKSVYTQYLKNTTTFSAEKIRKEVDRIEKLGTIEEEAKEVLPDLVKLVQTKEQQALLNAQQIEKQKELKRQKDAQAIQEYLTSTEEIGGIKLNKKLKDNWMKEYNNIRTSNGDTAQPIAVTREQDPNQFDALLRFYHSIGLFKFDGRSKQFKPDFSALESLGVKKAVNKFQESVESEAAKAKKGGLSPDSIELTPDKQEHLSRAKEVADYFKKIKEASNLEMYNIDASKETSNY